MTFSEANLYPPSICVYTPDLLKKHEHDFVRTTKGDIDFGVLDKRGRRVARRADKASERG